MPLLLLLFFGSGAAGLAYQVLWLRQLSYIFGVTAYAASTVLAAFMAGLALGSWLAGPILARVRRPLAAFGYAELLVGLSALATPVALGASTTLYRSLYAVAPDSFALQTVARFFSAFVVLLVPTLLMGLTLPLLSASPLVRGPRFASRVGALYAVNTAGAVTGALLTGFILIGGLGMQRTFLLAAVVNTLAGLGAIALDRRLAGSARAVAESLDQPANAAGAGDATRRDGLAMAWLVVGASGFASLALEVAWFRVMTQYVDATTYAFTTTLAIVLVGIAIGGAVAARLLRVERDWHAWLAALQLATGIAVLLGIGLITWDDVPLASGMRPLQRVLLGFLVPSLLMGLSFPLLLRVGVPASGGDGDAHGRGRLVGRFYGVNVLGAIGGSLAGGFVLLPLLGTRTTIVVLAAVFVLAGIGLCAVHARRRPMGATAVAGVALFAVLVPAVPDPFVTAALSRIGPGASEIFRDEGVQAAVSVHASRFQRTLQVSGLHQANDSPAMVRLHRQIGALPMALHPRPARALVIGLGGGVTAGAVSRHAGTAVQIVELSESVRKAAALFAHVNDDVLNRPNVRVRVDDGRNFLLLSGERFDVVTADIIQPNHAGAGALYSREYFGLVKDALAPGGLVLQWIGPRQRSHYELIMRTFHAVFPHTTLWLDGQLMVGSLEPLRLDEAAFTAKLADAGTRRMLEEAGLDSFETLKAWYTAGPTEIAAFVGDGPVLDDDRPLVEYFRSLPEGEPIVERFPLRGSVAEVLPR